MLRQGILVASEYAQNLRYRPKTREAQQTYGLLLAFVQQCLGDQPQDVLCDATDEVLALLKDTNMKDFDKKRSIEGLLESLSTERFTMLMNLGKKVTDYESEIIETPSEINRGTFETDETGVAVVFDDEEDENKEENQDQYEISEEEEEKGLETKDSPNEWTEEGDSAMDSHESSKFSEFQQALKTNRSNREDRTLEPREVDAYWLQRQLSKYYSDALTSQQIAKDVLEVLVSSKDNRECENRLVQMLNYDKFDLVKLFTRYRFLIYYGTKLGQAPSETEREFLQTTMRHDPELMILLQEFLNLDTLTVASSGVDQNIPQMKSTSLLESSNDVMMDVTSLDIVTMKPRRVLDLEGLSFSQGGHHMTNQRVELPSGSTRHAHKGYEEIMVPAPVPKPFEDNESLITIDTLPDWAQLAFAGMTSLNRVQSRLYETMLFSERNVLLCAPTGAGKTNVALLAILQVMSQYRNPENGVLRLDEFKVVYVAPMKALVQEMVGSFSQRLQGYGVRVAELTGDRMLTRQQLRETQIIVTTPEKWDIITRKATDESDSIVRTVRLMIFDEIHLLHDDRGPVLESLVARVLRQTNSTSFITRLEESNNLDQRNQGMRLVALSATLPNYMDVAHFLRIDDKQGVFFFDNSYRPCPLAQCYIGLMEKKPARRMQLMNEVTYEKVAEQAGRNQILIFVHSRKETVRTAKALRDMALEKSTIGIFLRDHPASREILQMEAESTRHADLKELLPYGFAVHHAGMSRVDRTLVEDLFADKHIQVLISTATLAWGVNLPAHTVIIKGTQIYRPEKGCWNEISSQDVMQMLGRAGRPQFDTHGEGILITSHSELPYYLSLLNQQLSIESQLLSPRLLDALNAEIVLGTVRNREEAIDWLSYTYLYVRMLREPTQYGITIEETEADETLIQHRLDIVHSAALKLDQHRMIIYDRRSGQFRATELGRIASHYYVTTSSMATYQLHLKSVMSDMELLRVFALSEEFKFIPVREEEKLELAKLLERVPIPIKESLEEPTAKINVLLQAYISQLKLEGFALMADMVYVTQSAARLFRAIFEMALTQGWACLSRHALHMSLMVEKRMWSSMFPLRQFKTGGGSSGTSLPDAILRSLEKKDIPFERLYDLKEHELGELVRQPKIGKTLYRMLRQFPKFDVQATIQPITRSMLHVEVTLTADFQMDPEVHGTGEPFWLLVEDCNSEKILYHDYIVLKTKYATEPYKLDFMVPLLDPLHPTYFMTILSDRWLSCEMNFPMSFKYLLLPEKCPPPTNLLDLQPLALDSLQSSKDKAFFASRLETDDMNHAYFNGFQTQAFSALYTTDESVLVCAAAPDNEMMVCAELALLRLWGQKSSAKALCIEPTWEMAQRRAFEWRERLLLLTRPNQDSRKSARVDSERSVTLFQDIGDDDIGVTEDLRTFEDASLIVCTARKWDQLSRRWQTKQGFQLRHVDLIIIDGIHLLGCEDGVVLNGVGSSLEIIVSRMRRIALDTKRSIRFVCLSVPMINAKDVADWIGCPSSHTFNFAPSTRSIPLSIEIPEGIAWSTSKLASLDSNKPVLNKQAFFTIYQHLTTHSAGLTRNLSSNIDMMSHLPSVLIFVPTNDDVLSVASQFLSYLVQELSDTDENQQSDDHNLGDGENLTEKKREFSMLRCHESALQPYLKVLQQRHAIVQHLLTLGIGCYHEGLSSEEKFTLEQLYRTGAIPLLICSRDSCWNLLSSSLSFQQEGDCEKGLGASMVFLLGTRYYSAKDCRHIEYPLFDVWRMLSFACRSPTQAGGQAQAIILCPANRRDYYRKMTMEALTVESHLDSTFGTGASSITTLQDHFNAEIAFRTLESKQEAVDYLTWMFFYRRMAKNPNYYRLQGTSHRHLSEHLSELIEATLEDLSTKDAECIEIKESGPTNDGDAEMEGKLTRTSLGHIAAHGYLHTATVQLFRVSLSSKTKLKGLLEMISAAMEFNGFLIRHHERSSLERLYQRMPVKFTTTNFRDPRVKIHVLLQCHFSRVRLSIDLDMDLRRILRRILPLIHAVIDISGQEGYLAPALAAMEFSQMIVQAMWDRDSDLKQLPHMTAERIERCTKAGVASIADLMDLPDDRQRQTLLELPDKMLAEVAHACNRYPAIDLEFAIMGKTNLSQANRAHQIEKKTEMEIDSPITTVLAGDEISVMVRLEREGEDEEKVQTPLTPVIAPWFPERKLEGWWLMIGDSTTNEVFALKRVHATRQTCEVNLKFIAPEAEGTRQLLLYFICDSYVGCDQEYPFTLNLVHHT